MCVQIGLGIRAQGERPLPIAGQPVRARGHLPAGCNRLRNPCCTHHLSRRNDCGLSRTSAARTILAGIHQFRGAQPHFHHSAQRAIQARCALAQ